VGNLASWIGSPSQILTNQVLVCKSVASTGTGSLDFFYTGSSGAFTPGETIADDPAKTRYEYSPGVAVGSNRVVVTDVPSGGALYDGTQAVGTST
jgi:hypothetical protein